MKRNFFNWMINHEHKTNNTAYSYSNSIDKISKHHSQKTGILVDIYSIDKLELISDIASDYKTTGRFAKYGYEGNATIRNAIATYARFYNYIQKKGPTEETHPLTDNNHKEIQLDTDHPRKNSTKNSHYKGRVEIQVVTSAELDQYDYMEIMPGVYAFPAGGRVLFVQPDDSALLIVRAVE